MDVELEIMQQFTSDLFSLLLPKQALVVVFSCKQKTVIREIKYDHLNVNSILRYFISGDLTHLVIVEEKKKHHISKILNLTNNTHHSIKKYEIFGIRQEYMLGAVQYHKRSDIINQVTVLRQFEPKKKGNSSDGNYFYTIGETYCKCFESSYLFIQPSIQRYWLFLNNNKRFQYDEHEESSDPLSNIAHNQNYYIFGQNIRTQAKYMVRLNSRLKKIRQFMFNTFDPTVQQFGQWIYIRGENTLTKKFPFIDSI